MTIIEKLKADAFPAFLLLLAISLLLMLITHHADNGTTAPPVPFNAHSALVNCIDKQLNTQWNASFVMNAIAPNCGTGGSLANSSVCASYLTCNG